MKNKKTIVLGATNDNSKYAYLAAERLAAHGHPIINVGRSDGHVAGMPIEPPVIIHNDVDTITLYVAPHNQPALFNYILQTRPRRIIFNPGTENRDLEALAIKNGIAVEDACTLVLLATGQY